MPYHIKMKLLSPMPLLSSSDELIAQKWCNNTKVTKAYPLERLTLFSSTSVLFLIV
jgi:hypothetical protein